MEKNESPELVAASDPGRCKTTQQNSIRPNTKLARVLAAFVNGGSFNRFEAERELHDHCLHTTVSILQALGVIIFRQDEVVRGFQGNPTHVCRYWLSPESIGRAKQLLGWEV